VNVFNVHDATGPLRRISVGGLNCQVFAEESKGVGTPPVLADELANVFAKIGACNK
jgi:hypothetical protein